MKAKTSWLFLALGLAVALVALDYEIKNWILANLTPFQVVNVIPGILDLTLVTNNSAGFSIGFGFTQLFAVISSLAALATIWYLFRVETIWWALLGGAFLGGIVGNLIDRFAREPYFGSGRVIDYIKIPFNFPIFNFADSLIVVVAIVTVIAIMRGYRVGKAGKVESENGRD